jgi:hypothetical protein
MIGINPDNPKQGRVFLSLFAAYDAGEKRHAEEIIKDLASKLNFKVLESLPQSIVDGWDFWIEFEVAPELPAYFRNVPWKPIGQA